MKTKRYLLSLAASALFLSGAYAADTELVLDASQDGLTWTDALWSNGTPQADISALINIGDSENPLLIQGEAVVGKLDVYNNSYLLLTGEGNSLKTTLTGNPFGDIQLYDNSKLVVSNGASLTMASGMSLKTFNNASFEVDNATFTGKFDNTINAVFKNGSTWNVSEWSTQNANIQVLDSNILQNGDFKMGGNANNSKFLTVKNSVWNTNGKGINLAGIVNIENTSIANGAGKIDHFNIGAEGGQTRGTNIITLSGTSAENLTTVNANNIWWNTSKDASTTFVLNGNTLINANNTKSDNETNGGGDATWLIQNSNNTVNMTDMTWGDNNKGKNESGTWLLTTAKKEGSSEIFAQNTAWKINSIDLRASSKEGSTHQALVDWAGATNDFLANYDIRIHNSTGINANTISKFTIRDGATATTARHLVVGNQNALSGAAIFEVKDGGKYTMKQNVNVVNSTLAGSTATSDILVEGTGTFNHQGGLIFIGGGSYNTSNDMRQDAISGTSTVTFKNAGEITFGGSILVAGSNVDLRESGTTHTNVAKLVIENTKFTLNGELLFGHEQKFGNNIYGGTSILEIAGENSAFISSNKGLYSGYNTTTYGGDRKILVSGKNNTVSFGSDGAFHMNSAGGAKQYGGSFELNIQGEGHTFQTGNNIDIGMKDAVGGSNTFYVKGTSSANKNKVLVNGGTIYIKASSDQESTIVNTMELAGNTILQKADGGSINFNLSSSDTAVAGAAKFIISGENNEVYLNNLSVGRSDLDSANILFQIEGSTHNINAVNFALRTSGLNMQAATLSFVSDSAGISTLKTTSVNELSGFIDVDFSKYVAQTTDAVQFILISAENNWDGSNYETDSDSEYIKVALANENDTWRTFMEGNNLVLEYTSAVIPEPSTFAAIFGAIALAFAAYRKKNVQERQ